MNLNVDVGQCVHCVLQKPMIENVCHTSAISHYMVQISYSRSGDKSVKSGYSAKIPANRTSILMSEEFKNHPMIMTTYNITVFAFNEGGRSNPSAIETISEYYVLYVRV